MLSGSVDWYLTSSAALFQLLQPALSLAGVHPALVARLLDDLGEGFSELFAPSRKPVGGGFDLPLISAAHLLHLYADVRKSQKAPRKLHAAPIRRLELEHDRIAV